MRTFLAWTAITATPFIMAGAVAFGVSTDQPTSPPAPIVLSEVTDDSDLAQAEHKRFVRDLTSRGWFATPGDGCECLYPVDHQTRARGNIMDYINVGAFLPNGSRPHTKAALKAALAAQPAETTFDTTSALDPQTVYVGDGIPPGVTLQIVGPDPYRKRTWYASVSRGKSGRVVVK